MTTKITTRGWEGVAEATTTAKAIAWDGCHKIYLAMDDEQVRQFESYGYGQDDDGSVLIKAEHASPGELYTYLWNWYEGSCFLRFISAVYTNTANPNAGFVGLIEQGEEE
jgi:hypothetical protein